MRTTTFLSLICAAGVLCGAAACSDEGEETTSTSTTSSSSTSATTTGATTSSSSGGGEGGGATTATTTTTTTTATTGTGGGGGAGGDGSGGAGGGGVSTLLNNCDPATATDLAGTNPTIDFPVGGSKYAPPCIKVGVGDKVTWNPVGSSFDGHPLVGGTIAGGVKTPDAASPILKTTSGTTAVTFTFDAAGAFGFYCDVHGPGGMAGAVFVE